MNFMRTTASMAIVAGSMVLTGAAIAQDKTYTIGVSVPMPKARTPQCLQK